MQRLLKRLRTLFTVSDLVPLLSKPAFRSHFINQAVWGIVLGCLPMAGAVARKTLLATDWQIGLVVAAPMLGLLISAAWSIRSTCRRPVQLVFWPQIIAGLLLLCVGIVKSAALFVWVFTAVSIMKSFPVPAYTTIMKHIYPQPVRGSLLSFINSRSYLVAVVFMLISGVILDWNPQMYRILFPFAGVASIISAFSIRGVKLKGVDLDKYRGKPSTYYMVKTT